MVKKSKIVQATLPRTGTKQRKFTITGRGKGVKPKLLGFKTYYAYCFAAASSTVANAIFSIVRPT